MSNKGTFEVGNCLIDQDLDRISNGSRVVTVRPQVMDVLVYLAARAGRPVHADELLEELWPEKVVTSASVYNCINELRQAFLSCDNSRPYIDTIPKKGYRLIAPVSESNHRKAATNQHTRRVSKNWLALLIPVVLASAALFFLREQWSVSEPRTKSIAVLPFVNMSPHPEQEHFADGLSEELLNSLATIGKLRVISRASSFAFKDRDVSAADIATVLHVDYILDGSVRRSGDTVRVAAQLIDTSTDSHIWSETYDRELGLDNILDIQDEIAAKVVDALNLRLLPGESPMLTRKGPANLRALDLFHEGMFYLNKIVNGQSLSRATFHLATSKFEEAISADPNWAPPHAALGRTYHFRLGNLDDPDPAEVLRTSTRHLLTAIRLDEDYGPAYGSLGYILATSGSYDAAMRAFDRARALNVDAAWGSAILMMGLGRYDTAIEEYRIAEIRNPLSSSITTQLATAYMCAGRFADAIETIENDEGIFVDDSVIADRKFLLSESYSRAGDQEKGLQLALDVAAEAGETGYVAYLLALAGKIERARSILNSGEVAGTDAFLEASWAWAVVGQENQALTMLEQATESALRESQPLWVLETLNCVPELQRFSDNPRYEAILTRLGMPD